MQNWWFLGVAIVAEVAATSALKASEGFTRLWPSVVVVLGYGTAFYCLSLTLRSILARASTLLRAQACLAVSAAATAASTSASPPEG